jgi:alanyl-tRNA synthetase
MRSSTVSIAVNIRNGTKFEHPVAASVKTLIGAIAALDGSHNLVLATDAAEVRFEQAAEDATDEARVANDRSDDYVLMTILFATVLFFAGISSKMDTLKARVLLLSVGSVLLVGSAAIVLAAVDGGKVQLAAGVTADSIGRVKAGELVNFVAQQVGGKGGGKPDMAMAGGTDAAALPKALASVAGWVGERA